MKITGVVTYDEDMMSWYFKGDNQDYTSQVCQAIDDILYANGHISASKDGDKFEIILNKIS